MKVLNTQSDPRKNPDSPRVHGLRLTVNPSSAESLREFKNAHSQAKEPSPHISHAAGNATVGRKEEAAQLLTVAEVAALLRVPVSWVYGRTRKRTLERLPGYRLGKYWRFREDEILAWVKSQRGGQHAA